MRKAFSILLHILISSILFAQNGTVTDVEGNVYKTVKIGSQLWMAENLKTTKYNDGTGIPIITDSLIWTNYTSDAYCNFKNNINNVNYCGRLYNWYVVNTNKVCPQNWHVPSTSDWDSLIIYLANNGYNYGIAEKDIGKSLASTTGWTAYSNIIGHVGYQQENNNKSGFNAFPVGARLYGGIYSYLGYGSLWWSSSESTDDINYAYSKYMFSNANILGFSANVKYDGLSIRCVKNLSTPLNIILSADKKSICNNDSIILNTSVDGGYPPYSYTWESVIVNSSKIKVFPKKDLKYYVTVTDAEGTSKVDSISIKVIQPTSSSINATICDGSSYSFNGNAYSTTGTYTAHLTNAAGCDSLATLVLSVSNCINKNKTNLDSGLVACYPFNGNADDYSGNNNDGVTDNIAFIPDRLGNKSSAVGFHDLNSLDGSIKIPQSPSIQTIGTNNSISVSGWIYMTDWYDSGTHGQWFSVLNKVMETDIHHGWTIQIKSVGMIEFTKNSNAIRFDYPFELHKWYHIVYVYSVLNNTANFYINGQNLGAKPYSVDMSDVDGDLYFGYNPYGVDEWDSGAIDDFRIYNRELTVDELNIINDTTNVFISSGNASIKGKNTICVGESDTLTCSVSGGMWTSSNNKIVSISNSGIVNAISTGKAVINYYLPNSCNSSVSYSVTVVQKPYIELPKDSIYCNTITQIIKVTDTLSTFEWSGENSASIITTAEVSSGYIVEGTNTLVNSGIKSLSFTLSKPGTYTVTASNACGIYSDSLKIGLVSSPAIKLPSDTLLCTGKPILVNVSLPGTNKYLWQDNSTNPQYTLSKAGTYTVFVADTNNCSASKVMTVHELTSPIFFLPNDTIACNEILLPINVSCTECTYLWNDGSILPKYTIQNEGEYNVTVSNNCGIVSDSLTVKIVDCIGYLDVPNAFSPNGDGLNDVLYAVGRNIENIVFEIYDRWGQKVFESNSLSDGWDGTFKGRRLESATFMFTISATGKNDGKIITKKGNVALIR